MPVIFEPRKWIAAWMLVINVSFCVSCNSRHRDSSADLIAELERAARIVEGEEPIDSVTLTKIQNFCGDCHALPLPTSFEREIWYDEIEKGFEMYARSGRTDLDVPAPADVVRYYRSQAFEHMEFDPELAVDVSYRERFAIERVDWPDGLVTLPAISSLTSVRFSSRERIQIIATDMRDGSINCIIPEKGKSARRLLARTENPARITPCDWDKDGNLDLVVADLGSFSPYDHAFGKAILLKNNGNRYEAQTLAENLGRVSDVAVAGFKGDGQPNLVVAEFGHRSTGGIHLFSGPSTATDVFEFRKQVLDIRPGALETPAHDWDGDGKIDFLAAICQETESIDLFLNRGSKFDAQTIWSAPDLTFGLVGMEVVDFDNDGDQDVLYVNGDSFDNNLVNPSHGVQWLENLGDLTFRYHRLASVLGAYQASAVDIDNDRDMDVLVCANLPSVIYPHSLQSRQLAAVVLLENDSQFIFRSRVLEAGTPRYPALVAADFNDDNKIDFAVGTMLFGTDPPHSPASDLPRLAIWWQK